jgi:hypothetical protein
MGWTLKPGPIYAEPLTVTTDSKPRRRPRPAVAVAVGLAVLTSGGLVVQASRAASSATLQSEMNGWRSGKVVLGLDETSAALFTAKKVLPGQSGSRCVRVDYTGNVPAKVKLWTEASGTLASSLRLTVEEGTGGDAKSCVGFTTTPATLFGPAPLTQLDAQHGDVATGLSSWAPTGAASRTYRLTWSLPVGQGSSGQTASATFHWNATQA